MKTIELLAEYRKSVDAVAEIMKNNAPKFNHFLDKKKGIISGDEQLFFEFHGMGCFFEIDGININVDINWREGGRFDWIDLWFLKEFWESLEGNTNSDKLSEIENEIARMLESGELIQCPHYRSKFYLPEDWGNPSPKKWLK